MESIKWATNAPKFVGSSCNLCIERRCSRNTHGSRRCWVTRNMFYFGRTVDYAIRLHEILQGFGTLFLTGRKKKKGEVADSSVKRAALKVVSAEAGGLSGG